MARSVDELVEDIKGLSILDVSELGKKLQEVFGVTAMAPASAAPAGGGGGGEAAPAEEAPTSFNVVLTSAGDKKIQVIKTVREIVAGLGLKEAKELVDGAPKNVKESVTKEEADAIKAKLEEQGATAEIKPA
ncbi:MAG: 50S ribosomal protein L7/L12 [Chloroflexi bacterium]|nr:50S ribosomal protein L7/L12 [Chloroflexota bacterium]